MSVINVAIVEDDALILQSIKNCIESNDDMFCCGACSSAEELIESFHDMDVHVVIMDITLPGQSGIHCVLKLKQSKPDVQFLMCTAHSDNDKVFDSLCAGATGYILKSTSPETLAESIREIHRGGSPMSSEIARKVVNSFPFKNHNQSLLDTLTTREKEILLALSKGYQYKEIADQLMISVETVRTYVRKIYEKLHVHSRTEAINKLFPK